MALGDWLSFGTGLLSNVINWFSGKKTNETNQKINKQNLDYNAHQTQMQWERDDNAHQREVADLKAAGLSPLAALGGADSSAPLGAPSPIAAQAPQIDSSQLVQAILSSEQLKEQKRHNQVSEGFEAETLSQEWERLSQSAENLKIQDKNIESQINERIESLKIQSQQLDELKRQNNVAESQKEKSIITQQMATESEMFYKEIKSATGGDNVNYKIFTNQATYEVQYAIYLKNFKIFVDKLGATSSSSTNSSNNSNSRSNSIGINALGSGSSNSASKTTSEGNTISESKDISFKQQKLWEEFNKINPVPVFIPKGKYKTLEY